MTKEEKLRRIAAAVHDIRNFYIVLDAYSKSGEEYFDPRDYIKAKIPNLRKVMKELGEVYEDIKS